MSKGVTIVRTLIAAGLLATLTAVPAHADQRAGFYWGVDLGQSSYDLDESGLNSALGDALADAGYSVLDGTSETSEEGFTWGITFGYQFMRYLAVEAAWVDLGSAEFKNRSSITDGVATVDLGTTVETDSAGAVLSALGTLPLGAGWEFFGRVGAYFGSNDVSADLTLDGVGGSLEDDSSSQSLMWGVGAAYSRGQWTTRLEYQQYTDVGDDDGLGEVDVDRIVFSAVYNTGFSFWR
jgi:hypothetical protein